MYFSAISPRRCHSKGNHLTFFPPFKAIRIYHECDGVIEKSIPRITDWHHEACLVMTNGDHEGIFFYPIHTPLKLSFMDKTTEILIWCARKFHFTDRDGTGM